MSEYPSNGGKAVSLVVEMREAIIELAGNRALYDTRDLWLERAARVAGISKRMAKTFFYNEPCNPSAEVVDAVRAARDNLRAKTRDNANVANAARVEYRQLLARIERIESAIRVQDADEIGRDGASRGGSHSRNNRLVD
jgi:hypothetical protein